MVDRDWQGELSEALGLAAAERRSAASGAADIEHRLARVEAMLAADLDRLGDAVLGATASRLDARLQALAERIDSLLAPSTAGEAGGAASALPPAQLEHLNRRLDEVLDRLDRLARSLAR